MNEDIILGIDGTATPTRHSNGNSSRSAMLRFLPLLKPEIALAIKERRLQVSDKTIHVTNVPIATLTTVKVFNDDNGQIIGKGNISKGKLESGVYFALTAIRVLYGVGADVTVIDFAAPPAILRNGEFTLRINGAEAITKASMECFQAAGNNNREVGTFYLDNPKLIVDQEPIEFNVEWQTAAPANAYLKVMFIGSTITKS